MSAFRDWQPNRFYRILIAVAVWEFAALVTTIIWRSMARPLDTLPWETVFIVKTLVWQIWGLIVPLILAVARRYSIANTTNKIKNLTILIIMSIIILTVYGVVYVATLEFYFIGKIMLRWTINYGQTFLTLHILYFFFGIWLLFLLEHIFSYTRHIRELSIRAVQGKSYLYATTLAGLENVLGEKFLRIHRGYIVNCSAITEVKSLGNGRLELMLRDNTKLQVSRRKKSTLRRILDQLAAKELK